MYKRGDKIKIINSRNENCFEYSVSDHIGKILVITSIRDEVSVYAKTEGGIEYFYFDEFQLVGD